MRLCAVFTVSMSETKLGVTKMCRYHGDIRRIMEDSGIRDAKGLAIVANVHRMARALKTGRWRFRIRFESQSRL
jgi:hypothetical protein